MTKPSWSPPQTDAEKAHGNKPSTLFECGHGLSVAHMTGQDTCNAADQYIRELEQKVADVEYWALAEPDIYRLALLEWANAPQGPNRAGVFWERLHAERAASES